MKRKITIMLTLMSVSLLPLMASAPSGYYSKVDGKSGQAAILQALNSIVGNPKVPSYDGLYEVYKTADLRSDGKVWDMYSTCSFNHDKSDHCGTYKDVCDCYNREHSIPQSWFGKSSPMVSDAMHVVPTDGKVNGQRSNYPFGECSGGTRLTSKALGKLGSSTFSGYSGKVFEPDDEFKGDFARIYFYMVATYLSRDFTQDNNADAVFTYSGGKTGLTSYAVNLFLKWHRQDPVSAKEIARNDAIQNAQGNRNPFVDYPCLVEYIWGDKQGQTVSLANLSECASDEPVDPIDPVDPEKDEFRLLPVTDVHANSVVLHWTDAKVQDYQVDVYTKQVEGTESQNILTDHFDGETKYKVAEDSYIAVGEKEGGANSIRLGSGSKAGGIIYSGLDFTLGGVVRVSAKSYGSDHSSLSVAVGEQKQVFELTDSYAEYVLSVEPTSDNTLTIATLEKKLRAYVNSVEAYAGGEKVTKTRLAGYPRSVGNVLEYRVDGLQQNEQYFYTVTPEGQKSSEEDTFVTEEGWTGFEFVAFPTLECFATADGIELRGIEAGSRVEIYNVNGAKIFAADNLSGLCTVSLSDNGLYLVRVSHDQRSEVFKVRR